MFEQILVTGNLLSVLNAGIILKSDDAFKRKRVERPIIRVTKISKGYADLEFHLNTFNCLRDEQTAKRCELSTDQAMELFRLYLDEMNKERRSRPHKRAFINKAVERSSLSPFDGFFYGVPDRKIDELTEMIMEASERATRGCESCNSVDRGIINLPQVA